SDGKVGEDVTASVMRIPSIPKKLSTPIDGYVYGEVCLSWADFNAINDEVKEPFANPRNAAAGILRRKNPDEMTGYLSFFTYGATLSQTFDTQTEILNFLTELGFNPAPWNRTTLEESVKQIAEIEKNRQDLPYMIDGV